jgi:hypothetical protein
MTPARLPCDLIGVLREYYAISAEATLSEIMLACLGEITKRIQAEAASTLCGFLL